MGSYSTLSKATFIHFFFYRDHFCNQIVVLFYDDDTVDVSYNQQVVEVDNIMYHVVHDNHWLNLTINNISNYVMFPYYLRSVFVPIICLYQMVKSSTYFRPFTNSFNLFIFERFFLQCWVIFLEQDDALLNPYFLL